MKKVTLFSFFVLLSLSSYEQCIANASVSKDELVCGECITLTAYGNTGSSVFSETFNSGAPTGWAYTQTADYTNPCSPAGVDGTSHMWMGNASVNPRAMETSPYNLTAGGTVCFDMLYANQGGASPCEGPDLPSEGVYLQYSTNGGTTWNTIAYHDPLGGNDPTLTNWNNYCYPIPAGAMTAGVQIRWYQDTVSGATFDHWGIDNVLINLNDPLLNVTWQHDSYTYGAGVSGGVHPTTECLKADSSYIITVTNGTLTCYDTVDVTVSVPSISLSVTPQDTTLCAGRCVPINAYAEVIVDSAKIKTYENKQPESISTGLLGYSSTVDLNVTGLNMPNVLPNSIQSVCITGLEAYQNWFPFGSVDINDIEVILECPSGGQITLVPDNVTTGGNALGYNNGYQNTCFIPVGPSITTGSFPYTGSWQTTDPFNNLAGCTSNGVWHMTVLVQTLLGGATGTLEGWSITFQDTSLSYPGLATWNHGNWLSDSTILNPVSCAARDTSYILIVSDSGQCVSLTDTVNISFLPTPDAGRDSSYSSCSPVPVDLFTLIGGTPVGGGVWLNPNNNPVTMPITPGTDTIGNYKYIVTNGTCDDTAVINFTTIQQATFLGNDTSICLGETVNLSISVPNSGYLWSTGATTNSINVSVGGTYWVNATDSTFGCVLTDTIIVTSLPLPFAGTDSSYLSCATVPVDLFTYLGGGPLATGSWLDPSNTPLVMPITPLASPNGNYKYVITNGSGCTDTAVVSFTALVAGQANLLGADTSICLNETVLLLVSPVANTTYLWSTAATTNSITVSTTGTYWVNVTDTLLGCVFTDTIDVTVNPLPFAGNDGTYVTCTTTPYDLFNSLGGSPVATGSWLDPSNNPVVMPLTPLVSANGNYSYIVTNTSGCDDTAVVSFTAIVGQVTNLLGNDTTYCFENGPLTLTAINYPSVNSHLWNTGSTSNSITINDAGLYWVEGTTTSCGAYRDSIIILSCNPVIVMPNVFSPNGDAFNERFTPLQISGIATATISVFNRWGTKIYESTDITAGWTGSTPDGKECSEGTYYWVINYLDASDAKFDIDGHVTLTR